MTLGRKKTILDEDKYLDDLEFIIKRDFFPDSELLELQLKYFDAMDAQDFCAVKEIQLKLNRINETFENNKIIENTPKRSSNSVPYKNPSMTEERDLHLNEYLARNTSEDNDSYSDLQRKTIERQMNKLSWAFKAAKEYNESRFRFLENKKEQLSITDGKSQPNRTKDDLDKYFEYKVFNPVFFNPDHVALSAEERISLANKKSEICYENTRFKTPFTTIRARPKTNQNKPKIPGKIGHDGKELSSSGTPRIGGFSILARTDTPDSMTPGTTWGEIDGTPVQIPDSPLVSHFHIQEPSEREKLATEMASRAARKNRNKKQLAVERVKSNLSRLGSSSSSSCRSYMSPAAMKLLSRMTPSTPKSILNSRPNSVLSSVHKTTPSVDRFSSGATPSNRASITDNLLDI